MTDAEYDDDLNKHVSNVVFQLGTIARLFELRAISHDASKFLQPERSVFIKVVPKLKELTYGSDEYKENLKELGTALTHHYEENSHHPEHYEDGISGMTLVDLVEMLCDWIAATKRHADGDIDKSIEINSKRFDMSPQLVSIFKNTVDMLDA